MHIYQAFRSFLYPKRCTKNAPKSFSNRLQGTFRAKKRETLWPLFSHLETIQQHILPLLISNCYVRFHCIVVRMPGKGHYHLWWHTFFQCMYNKCPSCGVRSYHIIQGCCSIHWFLSAVLHHFNLSVKTKHLCYLLEVFIHFLV